MCSAQNNTTVKLFATTAKYCTCYTVSFCNLCKYYIYTNISHSSALLHYVASHGRHISFLGSGTTYGVKKLNERLSA